MGAKRHSSRVGACRWSRPAGSCPSRWCCTWPKASASRCGCRTSWDPAARVSFHLGLLPHDVTSGGVNVGFNPDSTVGAGASRQYTFYADEEQIQAAVLSDFGGDDAQRDGLYGAVVVAPAGARFTDPVSGSSTDVGTQVDVHVPGSSGYRDFSLWLADLDARIGMDAMPYPADVGDAVLVNYRSVGTRP